MRIGMVCPYSFDVPGGVQSHVLQLAEVMRARGHEVSVLAPSSPHVTLPDYVVSGGKAVPIPYNGSVARLRFGPATHRKVKRWLADGEFDVLHLHEPNAPSLSMLALQARRRPDRRDVPHLHHQIADAVGVSGHPAARFTRRSSAASRCRTWPGAGRWRRWAPTRWRSPTAWTWPPSRRAAAGRLSAARQDGAVPGPLRRTAQGHGGAAGALPALVERFPDIEVLIVGRGDEDELCEEAGPLADHLRFLGQVDDDEKASALRSADVYCAPEHRRGELRHRARGGDGRRHSGGGQRPRRVPAGAARRRGRPAGARRRRRCAGRGADRRFSTTTRCGAATSRPARRRSAATTGRWWPTRSCGSTRPSRRRAQRCRWPADDGQWSPRVAARDPRARR